MTATRPSAASRERRDRLSVRRGQRIFRASRCSRRTSSGPIPGVRPLFDDGASQGPGGDARLRAEAGGRRRRRAAAQHLRRQDHHLPPAGGGRARQLVAGLLGSQGAAWTGAAPLPGGDFRRRLRRAGGRDKGAYAFLEPALARRLVRAYGTRAKALAGRRARWRPWPGFRRRPLWSRDPLPDGARMGADGRRRALAAHQAGT